jgi:predicted amino acid racemase
MPAEVPEFLDVVEALEHVEVVGLGVSLTCFGAIVPTKDNLGELVAITEAAERQLGRKLLVSGGMSSTIDLAVDGEMPARIDNLRVGETMLLGVSTVTRERVLGLHTDAITLAAPVIECKVKPTLPDGVCAQDAFGNVPTFVDNGLRRRAILAIGRQDAPPEGLRPVDLRVRVLGASSDHLIVDVDDLPEPPAIGESLAFVPNYSATLRLFTSPYVEKEYVGGER